MELSIDGSSRSITNDKLRAGVEWLGKKLLNHQLLPYIELRIIFIRDLRKKRELYGFCKPTDSVANHRRFEITLDSTLGQKNILLSLCHEMVHVKQFAYGELRLLDNQASWLEKHVDHDEIDYWDRPWEIEAHGREQGLFLYLCEHFDNLGI